MHLGWLVFLLSLLVAGCGDSDHALGTVPPAATRTPVATSTASPSPRPTLEPLEIHTDAGWVRDRMQRVVLLRGADYSGLEFGNLIGNPHGPAESDFAQMQSWGFNVIRLPIAWSYLEPGVNQFTDRYLIEQVDAVIGFAAQHGIMVIPEMHQFQWSPCFGGNGAPAWTCAGRYTPDAAGQAQAGCDFFQGALAPDGRRLMDHFIDAWRLVAYHYAGNPRIAGFDFFNEPIAFTCITPSVFERTILNPFYRAIRAAVQAEGATQPFFYCPSITRNVMFPASTEPMGPNVAYAPHLYTVTGGAADKKYDGDAERVTADYALALKEAGKLGGPLFVGEFGGITDPADGFLAATELFLRDSLAEQDRRLVGGAVWAYFPSDNGFSVVDVDGNGKGDLVNILARPYARRIAGVPTAQQFDLDTKAFSFSFTDDSVAQPPDPTEIFIPAARHYPNGLAVDVTVGDHWAFDAAAQRLLLYRGPSTTHTVHVAPATP